MTDTGIEYYANIFAQSLFVRLHKTINNTIFALLTQKKDINIISRNTVSFSW
jgi:hypothetical protein